MILKKYSIKTLLDIPCGDFNWMKEVDITSLDQYVGADIVSKIVLINQKRYEDEKRTFVELDITKDSLPRSDLVICKDCFEHLMFNEVWEAIENVKRSGSLYLLMTTFQKEQSNADTKDGKWRPINFQISPFSFPDPIEYIDTDFTDGGKQIPGKGMAMWRISDLSSRE